MEQCHRLSDDHYHPQTSSDIVTKQFKTKGAGASDRSDSEHRQNGQQRSENPEHIELTHHTWMNNGLGNRKNGAPTIGRPKRKTSSSKGKKTNSTPSKLQSWGSIKKTTKPKNQARRKKLRSWGTTPKSQSPSLDPMAPPSQAAPSNKPRASVEAKPRAQSSVPDDLKFKRNTMEEPQPSMNAKTEPKPSRNTKTAPKPSRNTNTENVPSAFDLFCAYHLGIMEDGSYKTQNINTVARRFNISSGRLKTLLIEYGIDSDTIINADFDMALAQLDMMVAPEGIDRRELARTHFEEFEAAPKKSRDWNRELAEDAEANRRTFGK